MGKLRKVYLPKWMTWFGLAMLVPMWGWVTYETFFTGGGRADSGIGGWIAATLVLALVGVVLVLMGARRLPAYLLETEEEDGRDRGGA